MKELNQEELLDWFVNYINTRAIPLHHMKRFKQIVALIQKSEVTEEWIEEKAREISHAFNDIPRVGMEEAKNFIRSLLKEAK